MLVLDRLRGDLVALPLLARIGLAVIAFGGFADVVAHVSFVGGPADEGHTAAQLSAHAVAFAGMVLVLAGVVVDGVRQSGNRRKRRPRSQQGGT